MASSRSLLDKYWLLFASLLLCSCMVSQRDEWSNSEDPDGPAWVEHRVGIVSPNFGEADSFFVSSGGHLILSPYPKPILYRDLEYSWDARNEGTGETLRLSSGATGGIDAVLGDGNWILTLGARTSQGGAYQPDSAFVVVGGGNDPVALDLPDTIFFGVVPLPSSDTIGLSGIDPHGRDLSFSYTIDGFSYSGRSVELSRVAGYGAHRVSWVVRNSVGLIDTSSFVVTVRVDTIVDRGVSYRIGRFGAQVWMIDNLRRDTANGVGSWCYDDKPENCARYGRLYDWPTATAGHVGKDSPGVQDQPLRGICPKGWHIPTFVDVMTLKAWLKRPDVLYVPDELVGRAIESDSLWKPFWSDSEYRGVSGFNLLPGGYYDAPNRLFRYMGAHGDFWTSQHWNSDSARIMAVFENSFYAASDSTDERISQAGNLMSIDVSQKYGMPVRCLQN